MPRLFIAVWPPPRVVAAVAEAVPQEPRPGVRWVPPRHWHVTLRFLGQAAVDEACAALDGVVADRTEAIVGPALVTLGRSVLVVPVDGLGPLAVAVQRATAHVGEPVEDRRFTGHLTVARRKGRATVPVGTPVADRFEVDAFTLVQSETRPTGAEYRVLRSWNLPVPPAGAPR